jgi:diguanylate cyclase (GGDEF)-like protein/PAS domain S-box-containing protein
MVKAVVVIALAGMRKVYFRTYNPHIPVSIFDQTHYAFAAYAVPVAVTTLLMLAFGASVLVRRPSRVTASFFAMTVSASVWLFAFTWMDCARDSATALFWARLAYFGVPFIAATIYHFTTEMLHITRRRRVEVIAGWILATVFSYVGTQTDLLVVRVDRFWFGYYPRYSAATAIPFLTFFFGYLVGSLGEFIRAYPVSRGVEKKRIRLLLIAFAVAYVGCIDYLPKFGIPIFPAGYVFILGFVLIVALAFRRYDLVAITPSLAAREIIGTMADALFVCDRDGTIQLVNRATENVLGFEAQEVIGKTIEDLVAPGGEPFNETLRRRSIRSVERLFVGKDNRIADLMLSIAPILHHGEPAGAVIIGRDMRERREAEREVRKAVSLLESTLDSTADGILVSGDGGRILSYNQRFSEMWHIPPGVLEGRDDRRAIDAVLDQLLEPEEFVRTVDSIYSQPEAESFDLIEFKDGRRFERFSMGRKIEGVGTIRVWSFRDVTARFAAEAAMRDSELRYRLLFEQNAAGVCVKSAAGVILDCNSTFARTLGYPRGELIGTDAAALYARPEERVELMTMLRDASSLNSVEVELRRKNGEPLWVLQNLTLAGDRVHMTVVDISDRKRAEEQIEFHAYHDVLTQLPNRKLFTDRLMQNITRSRRSGKALAVMFVDLDHFKTINDTLGHEAGDELLLEMAHRLRQCIREDDTVARLGGDEFTIILSELRHPEDAANVAEKIIDAVARPMSISGAPIEISASIGIAVFPDDGMDPETLLRNADSAMYRAKEAGRSTYQLCTDEMKRRAQERLSLETRLRRAINEEQLTLHYQPQVSLSNGSIVGVEALVRWNDPERGLVHPSAFIPLAEESRLILPLGEWVLRTACTQMRRWRDEGLELPHVSVNLSARQFQQNDVVDSVRRALADTGLDPGALELEITETAAMQNAEASVDVLHALRDLGVGISIDDFGTGYSSLNYLKRFPLTAVKIDGVFVRDLATSEGDAAIVSAVVGIARSLRLRVVAEGVETEAQLSFLRRRKCDAAQGYLFSRPVTAESLAALVVERPASFATAPRLHV